MKDFAGQFPGEVEWEKRKHQFRNFESSAIGEGNGKQNTHPQSETMLLEMEHCYCAGAWVATVFLAQAIVEIHLGSHGHSTWERRERFLEKFNLDGGAKELRLYRNSLCHRDPTQPAVVSPAQLRISREDLRLWAKRAVSVSLNIRLLGLKYPGAYDP